jgi:hypothetical protein
LAFLGVVMSSSIDTKYIVKDLLEVGRKLLKEFNAGGAPEALFQARAVHSAMCAVLGPFTGGAHTCEAEYQFRLDTVWTFDDEVTKASRA